MTPKALIIIVTWNGKEYLSDCLRSVSNQSYENFKVILVDNGSTDGSVEFIRENYPEIEIIALNKNYGFAKGNNIGIEEAFKDKDVQYIALLNVDTKVEPQYLRELINVAEADKRIGSCQSKVLLLSNPKIIDALGISVSKDGALTQMGYGTQDKENNNQIKEVFGACAGAALYKREMLEQIGLFDEDFFAYFEDVDLALRSRLSGWRCMYVPAAVVYHRHSYVHGENSPIARYFCERNHYYYIIKNMPIDRVLKFLLKQPINIILTILNCIKTKNFSLLANYLKGNFEAMIKIPKMFKKRVKLQSLRVIKAEELRKRFI